MSRLDKSEFLVMAKLMTVEELIDFIMDNTEESEQVGRANVARLSDEDKMSLEALLKFSDFQQKWYYEKGFREGAKAFKESMKEKFKV